MTTGMHESAWLRQQLVSGLRDRPYEEWEKAPTMPFDCLTLVPPSLQGRAPIRDHQRNPITTFLNPATERCGWRSPRRPKPLAGPDKAAVDLDSLLCVVTNLHHCRLSASWAFRSCSSEGVDLNIKHQCCVTDEKMPTILKKRT